MQQIQLLAASYRNIGPFLNRDISILFQPGSYVIKAPIGSGKSFLFFDGPQYALYKQNERNMLNVKAKDGFIKLLFRTNDTTYLITRTLKQGKSKDSTVSTLAVISDYILPQGSVIQEGDVLSSLLFAEQAVFKNETDLQAHLNEIIPPRSVLMSTMILLQDAPNIFEVVPQERLKILKNLFGLMGIDEAKDAIADKKRQIVSTRKALEETSNTSDKLSTTIKSLTQDYEALLAFEALAPLLQSNQSLVEERKFFEEKIGITHFSTADFDLSPLTTASDFIKQQFDSYQSLNHQYQTFIDQIREASTKKSDATRELQTLTITQNSLKTKITTSHTQTLAQKKSEKTELRSQQLALQSTLDIQALDDISRQIIDTAALSNERPLSNHFERSWFEVWDLHHAARFVDYLIASGTERKHLAQQKTDTLKHTIDTLQRENTTLSEKQSTLLAQEKILDSNLAQLQGDIQKQSTFFCDLVQTDCPFIIRINEKAIATLTTQEQSLLTQKTSLTTQLQALNADESITKNKATLVTLELELSARSTTPDQQDPLLALITSWLKQLNRKAIQENYLARQKIDKQIYEIDKTLEQIEQEIQKQESYKNELVKVEATINELQKRLVEYTDTATNLQKSADQIALDRASHPYNTLKNADPLLVAVQKSLDRINDLVADYKQTQIKIQELKHKEIIANNLYNILNKEILLLVLQDNMPTLAEIINSYLGQVVDYTIDFVTRNPEGELELDTLITDTKGARDIKSLSGGQRVILKLVRMLAVATHAQAPMLLLDETINNLDPETIVSVANMLQDFIKKHQVSLYVVTHSETIQDMAIRTDTIEIPL